MSSPATPCQDLEQSRCLVCALCSEKELFRCPLSADLPQLGVSWSVEGTSTRCFLKEEAQVLECLMGPPASQQLHGAGRPPAEEEGVSQAAGLRGYFQAPFTLGCRASMQPV